MTGGRININTYININAECVLPLVLIRVLVILIIIMVTLIVVIYQTDTKKVYQFSRLAIFLINIVRFFNNEMLHNDSIHFIL